MTSSPSWSVRSLGELAGRTYVVTGANSGIGLETARELVVRGAHVVLACRDVSRGEQARRTLGGKGSTSVLAIDLADLDSVAVFAKRVEEDLPVLSGLVLNAGVMGGAFAVTAQGHERQMGTNHLGHAALVSALWPVLVSSGTRVVPVSSIAARGGDLSASSTVDDLVAPSPYDAGRVYARTKQANLLFAQELHRRAAAAGTAVTSVAAHPGVSSTNLFPRQQRDSGRGWLAPVVGVVSKVVMQSAGAGAEPVLRALDHSTPSGAFVGPKALGQWRGRPELLDVYPTASDPAVAAHVWQLTEDVLGAPLLP
jgi:NAD(P)-dependent dehydrogenase (short-subunit alcohol dehydrogenase family)